MSKLTSTERSKLPDSKFAGPNRSYPVDTHNRAANAKARASQAVNEGRMSKATEAKIDAKANRILHEGGGMKQHSGKHETNSRPGSHVGGQMEHEKHMLHEDNVLHHGHFQHSKTHPDSSGSHGMHGDGKGHWSKH